MTDPGRYEFRDLQTFVVQLGAAMNAAGVSVDLVQEQLTRVAAAYGARGVRISAFPTFMMVSMGRGEPATLEITASFGLAPRLDQIAAVDRLVREAERGAVPPAEGIERLDEIVEMESRYGALSSVIGYAVLTVGLCLILKPAARDVVASLGLGALVGLLRWLVRRQAALRVLLPVLAAFAVSALSALSIRHDLTGPGLRAMVASLVVFLPGATLTTAVLELAAGQMVAGASRLVSGIMQLALLAFGIVAGIEAVGLPSSVVLADSNHDLGEWAPWLGVLVFAAGVAVANSAPRRSFPGLLVVLYAAWVGQVVGNAVFGAYVSAVPGALGLIGLAQLAGDVDNAGIQDLANTVVSIFAIAVGVLCGTLLLASVNATGKAIGSLSDETAVRARWRPRSRR